MLQWNDWVMGREQENTPKQIQREKRWSNWGECAKGQQRHLQLRHTMEVKGKLEKSERIQKDSIQNNKADKETPTTKKWEEWKQEEVKTWIAKEDCDVLTQVWESRWREKKAEEGSTSPLGNLIDRGGRSITAHITAAGKHTLCSQWKFRTTTNS